MDKLNREDIISDYVCFDCGVGYLTDKQKEEGGVSTFSKGECGVCKEITLVTHIRTYNYLQRK